MYEIPQGYREIQANFPIGIHHQPVSAATSLALTNREAFVLALFGPELSIHDPSEWEAEEFTEPCLAARSLESQNAPDCTLLQPSV
jgi:hypothetical protein